MPSSWLGVRVRLRGCPLPGGHQGEAEGEGEGWGWGSRQSLGLRVGVVFIWGGPFADLGLQLLGVCGLKGEKEEKEEEEEEEEEDDKEKHGGEGGGRRAGGGGREKEGGRRRILQEIKQPHHEGWGKIKNPKFEIRKWTHKVSEISKILKFADSQI